MIVVHKTAADTALFTFDQRVETLVGNVPSDPAIKMNGFNVIFVTFVSGTQLLLQFAGSISIGFPAVITGAPSWMQTGLNAGSVSPT